MKDSQYLDSVLFDAVGCNEGGANDDQFPGALDPAGSATLVIFSQTCYLMFNFVALFDGR